MSILPVLDLMQGQIVRGIAGRRDEYRPIVSTLTDATEPLAVARAFRDHFGDTGVYLADLDAIQHGQPALDVHRRLQTEGFRVWIDAGIRTSRDEILDSLGKSDRISVIVGLETVAGPEELRRIVERIEAGSTVFSLDLNAGRPLGAARAWPQDDPWDIAQRAIESIGIRRLIVLDLACVGVGAGVGTEDLCSRIRRAYPEVQLTAGGGVRHIDDVKRLLAIGVDHVLVASALHDGRITPDDLLALSRSSFSARKAPRER